MKIIELKTWFVRHPIAGTWKPFRLTGDALPLGNTNVVKITTDEGFVGWGTCFDYRGLNVPARTTNAKRVQEELGPQLLGKDPFMFEQLTELLNASLSEGINPWAVDLAL